MLYDRKGHRKYLAPAERETFLRAADELEREVRTFCPTLAYPGDLKGRMLIFESLRKRHSGVYRHVPVPPALIDALKMVHDIRAAQKRRERGRAVRLRPWARNTAWRHVGAVIRAARIKGPHATPKGLRHGFGIKAVTAGVPLTTIYAGAMGPEKRQLVERMWS